MLKKLRTLGILCLLCTVVVTASGCFALLVGAGAGAGTVAWFKGVLEKNVDANIDKSFSAAKKGLEKLKLPISTSTKDKYNAKIESSYPDGKKVTITVEALTEKASTIKIRVGAFGDKSRSESILAAIQRYL